MTDDELLNTLRSDVRGGNPVDLACELDALCDEAAKMIDRLRDALFTAQRRFELLAAGGVRITNGADPRLGAQEAKQALRGWRPT